MLYQKNNVVVRKFRDQESDYRILTKWLQTPEVLDYYEGRNSNFDYEKVLKKYQPRAQGKEEVTPCIIEYDEKAIGYIQFYTTDPVEYEIAPYISIEAGKCMYAIDLFIGEVSYWNKGIGPDVVSGMIEYLKSELHADEIFIDPQTWNKRAIHCYEKCGFEQVVIIENREEFNGEMRDSCIMRVTSQK